MFKFIAQLIVSATVGLAVAAGSNAGVRGEVEKAWLASSAYIQSSTDVAASIISNAQAESNVNANASADANANVESYEEAPAESAVAIQVNGNTTESLNVDETVSDVLPELNVQTEVATEADASVESEELDLTLLQQLGLRFGFGLGD